MAKLRGKKKADFLARMARGRKAASKRRRNAGSKGSRRLSTGRKRNPQLLTVNTSRSPSGRRGKSTTRSAASTRKAKNSSTPSRTRSAKRGTSRTGRRNPQLLTVMNPTRADLEKARKAYRQFHGVDPKRVAKLGTRGPILIALGETREIVYQPRRGHRTGPAFFHHFKAGNVLAVTADGKRLVIVDRRKRKAVDFDLGIVS